VTKSFTEIGPKEGKEGDVKVDGIPPEYPETVCLIGQGALCCSYIVIGPDGFACAKGTGLQALIDKRRQEKTMTALSDNCSGPPDFTKAEAQS